MKLNLFFNDVYRLSFFKKYLSFFIDLVLGERQRIFFSPNNYLALLSVLMLLSCSDNANNKKNEIKEFVGQGGIHFRIPAKCELYGSEPEDKYMGLGLVLTEVDRKSGVFICSDKAADHNIGIEIYSVDAHTSLVGDYNPNDPDNWKSSGYVKADYLESLNQNKFKMLEHELKVYSRFVTIYNSEANPNKKLSKIKDGRNTGYYGCNLNITCQIMFRMKGAYVKVIWDKDFYRIEPEEMAKITYDSVAKWMM